MIAVCKEKGQTNQCPQCRGRITNMQRCRLERTESGEINMLFPVPGFVLHGTPTLRQPANARRRALFPAGLVSPSGKTPRSSGEISTIVYTHHFGNVLSG